MKIRTWPILGIAFCFSMAAAAMAQQSSPLGHSYYLGAPAMGNDPFGNPPGMTSVKPDVAADGDGVVWAIFSRTGPQMAQFRKGEWKNLQLEGFSESLNAQKLTCLAGGYVACLWSDRSRENAWHISRHR
ncbi:MAG: hypothetical protein NTY98_16560, partial [Verrucomicrobia bacterium]|nr:hypothetical protein [Verrucomicrobiota bacterium]